jgi:hypothetical protein
MIAVKIDAHARWKTKSVMTKTVAVTATASEARPAIVR